MLDDFEIIYQKIFDIIKNKLQGAESCHDFDHTLRVLHNCRMLLAELPEADHTTVLAAALLHDACRPEETASCGKLCHALLGAEFARSTLQTLGVPQSQSAPIVDAIRTHRFRDDNAPETIEAKIVYDADKLDSLGAVGIGRAFLFAGHNGARLHNTAKEALTGDAYGREDTAYREYLVKLQKLPDAMLTAPGKRKALERAQFMAQFFSTLDQETELA